MKKILILMHHAESTVWFRRELVEALCGSYEVHLSVPDWESIRDRMPQEVYFHDASIERRNTNPIKDYQLYKEYCRTIKGIKPDIILSFTIKPNIYGSFAAKKFSIPVINTVTGLGTIFQNKNSYVFRIAATLYKIAFSYSKCVIFQNEESRQTFIQYGLVGEQKTRIVSGSGINTQRFQPIEIQKNNDATTFLFIGRIMKEKGIHEFVSAAKKISDQESKSKFKIMGMVEDPQILKEIEGLDFIEYLGQLPDPREEIAKSDCVVLPSYHEGMANTLLEGASMGKPLIASDISGCREAIEEGVTGFLCKAKDVGSLTASMNRFLALDTETRKEMGRKGREKMLEEFDRRNVIFEYEKIISRFI